MCSECDLDSLRGSVTAFNEEVAALTAAAGISAQAFRLLGEDGTRRLIELIRRRIGFPKKPGHTGACDGVYIAYVDYDGVKRIVEPESWSDDLGAAQGVMVGDGTHEVMFALEQIEMMKFSEASQSNPEKLYGVITTDSDGCIKDFNGRLNTEAIVNMGGDYESAEYATGFCHQYASGVVGAGEWWLPSGGEIAILKNRIKSVPFYTLVKEAFEILGIDYDEGNLYYIVSTIPDSDDYTYYVVSRSSAVSTRARNRAVYNLWPVTSFDYVIQ